MDADCHEDGGAMSSPRSERKEPATCSLGDDRKQSHVMTVHEDEQMRAVDLLTDEEELLKQALQVGDALHIWREVV